MKRMILWLLLIAVAAVATAAPKVDPLLGGRVREDDAVKPTADLTAHAADTSTHGVGEVADAADVAAVSAEANSLRDDLTVLAWLDMIGRTDAQVGTAWGPIDVFSDQAGIDDDASSGEYFDADADCYSNTTPGDTNQWTGGTATGGAGISYPGGGDATNLLDANAATRIQFNRDLTEAQGNTWDYDLGAGNTAQPTELHYEFYSIAGESNKVFYLRGSNDGTNWTQVAQITATTGAQVVAISPVTAYRYWRIGYSGNGSNDFVLGEAGIYGATTAAMVLVSESYTLPASPSAARPHVLADLGDGALNTDLLMDVSRDDGTTWVTATLTTGVAIDATWTDYRAALTFTGPAGTSLLYRIRTTDAYTVRAKAAAPAARE